MNENNDIPVITIDGPSGTGKGTISQSLAKYLGWNFLDSGSLYRILAFALAQKKIDLKNVQQLTKIANELDINFVANDSDVVHTLLDNEDITQAIRSEECANNASIIAAIPEVRAALLQKQRDFLKPPGLVTDGRDMGTVVFPDATLKIFLTASSQERAKRRYYQLQNQGRKVSLEEIEAEITLRDERDMKRPVSPLKPAEDAIILDTTILSREEVFENIVELVKKHLSANKKSKN